MAASSKVVTSVTARTRYPGVSTRYRSSRTVTSAGNAAYRSASNHLGRLAGLNQTTI